MSADSKKSGPTRMHHLGFTTDDHEVNRQFYEDVLGLPLKAMWIERELIGDEAIGLGHAFYELADGSALAFFSFADPEKQAAWKAQVLSPFIHIALKVDAITQAQIEGRLKASGHACYALEHGYCRSLYAVDPNGLKLEFAVDPGDVDEIAARMASTAAEDMRRWMSGDRAVNNHWRVTA